MIPILIITSSFATMCMLLGWWLYKVSFREQGNSILDSGIPGFIAICMALFVFYALSIPLGIAGLGLIILSAYIGYELFKKTEFPIFDWKFVLISSLFLMIAAIVANYQNAATSNYDTGAYHSVLVKWLTDYGFVKGIANLDPHYGLFSPTFLFAAFLENLILPEKSWQILNGIIVLLHLGVIFKAFTSKPDGLEMAILTGYILTLFFSRFFISSLSPDLWVNLSIPYCVLLTYRFFKTQDCSYISLLWIVCIFTVWVKLSALAILVFPLICTLWMGKKYLNSIDSKVAFITGAILVVFFLYSNVWLTGYLIYPLEFTKINVWWAVDEVRVEWFNRHIYLWGITPNYDFTADYSGFWWIRDWLAHNLNPGLYRFDLFACAILLITFPVWLLQTTYDKKFGLLLFAVFIIAGIIWFTGSPNMRFFRPWIWTVFGINITLLIHILFNRWTKGAEKKYIIVVLLLYLLPMCAIESGIRSKLLQDNMWFKMYDTPVTELKHVRLDSGVQVSVPVNDYRPWYAPLPSARLEPVHADGDAETGFRSFIKGEYESF